ncbi:MAG: hypothetical protein JWR54_3874 [Mucilaginibacter sp.]|nr:hypothetical protein [Mucilaginibacter sp.]
MEFFDEINNFKSLFLLDIEEPRDNQVLITIQETTVVSEEEYVPVGDKTIGPVRRIIANENCKKFSFFFNSYAAYTIINESFPLWHDYEEWTGKLLRIYSKSNYLDYIRKDTAAEEFYDHHGWPLKHFSINCENHVIHIASMEDPVIKMI